MKLENNVIVFEGYDIDHILTGRNYKNNYVKEEEIYKKALKNFQFEYSLIAKNEDNINLEKISIRIPKNLSEKKIKTNYENFKELVKELLKYKNNKDVFPYYF